MTKLSLFDKLGILLEVSKSSKLIILAIAFIIFLAIVFITTNKKNSKTSKKIYLSVCAFIVALVIIVYHSSLLNMFDYMMNNLFYVVYFPNLAVYFAAIIITNIILWISVFDFKTDKIIKNINIIVYSVINYILILILSVINAKKLDVFSQTSIYKNKNALGLIELTSTIFILWIIFLIIYKIIMKYQNKNKEVVTPKKNMTLKKKKRVLPSNIVEITIPKYVKQEPKKLKIEEVKKEVPLTKKHNPFDDLLTIEDYKLLLKMLKEIKEKEKQEAERKKLLEDEQSKFRELQELYKSVK